MTTKRLAEVMIDKLPHDTAGDYVDRLLLRIFSVPSLLTFFRDSSRDGHIVELSFFMLPDSAIAAVEQLIGDYPTKVYRYSINGRNMTGFKFDISSLRDRQKADDKREVYVAS